jgi:hypothetical protein
MEIKAFQRMMDSKPSITVTNDSLSSQCSQKVTKDNDNYFKDIDS